MMQLPDDTIRFLSEWVPRLRNNSFSYMNLVGQDLDPQVRRPVRVVSASASVNPIDDLVLVSGNTTMTLESAVACDGRRHTFIKTDAGTTMTIAGTPSIDGGASVATATQYAGIMVISNGTTWNAIRLDIATSVGILGVVNGGTGVAVSGTTAQIAVGGGTTSPIVWTTATGTGAPVRAGTPTITTPNIVGTSTNDSAAAGSVGEFISGTRTSGSALGLTSNVAADVTSVSLTAGDWDVSGHVYFTGNVATTVTYMLGCMSLTTATLDLTVGRFGQEVFAGVAVYSFASPEDTPIPMTRISVASTTPVYLVAQAGFAVSTCAAYGIIQARRRR